MKTSFVTGGCGFVGRHLVKKLLEQGYSVWILDDLSTGRYPAFWLPRGFDYNKKDFDVVYFNRGEQQVVFIHQNALNFFLNQLNLGGGSFFDLPEFKYVIHLASIVGGRVKIEGDPISVGLDLAIDSLFFKWIAENKNNIEKVLYASSSAAYPTCLQTKEKSLALKETYLRFGSLIGMPDMTYGWSKLSGEYLSRVAAAHYGISIACVRPFSGYGGDQDQSYPIPAIAKRAALKEDPLIIWGSGEQGRDFVHIDDCIDAMLIAIEKIRDGGAVNIGSGVLTTFKAVAAIFAELAGYSPQIKPLSDKPEGVQSRYSDIFGMKNILKWEPRISLRQGFKEVLEKQIDICSLS